MLNKFIQIMTLPWEVSIVIVIISLTVFFVLIFIKKNKNSDKIGNFEDLYTKIRDDIKYAVAPKFLDLSVGVNDLIELALEVWRIEQRINKSTSNLSENNLKGLENSIQKMKRYLGKYDMEILDYKNKKYNDGLNLDILDFEIDLSLSEPIIKETIEPTILCKGQVVRKAKIILIKNH